MQFFINFKTRTKLVFAGVFMAVVAAVIGFIGLLNINSMANSDDYLYRRVTAPLGSLMEMIESFQSIRLNLRDSVDATAAASRLVYADEIAKLDANFREHAKKYQLGVYTRDGQNMFDDAMKKYEVYIGISTAVIRMLGSEDVTGARNLMVGDGASAARDMVAAIDALRDRKVKAGSDTAVGNLALARQTSLILIMVCLLAVVLALIMGLTIAGMIAKPLETSVAFAKAIADGDLSQQLDIKRKDEIGQLVTSLNTMCRSLQGSIREVQGSAQTVAAASTELSAISRQVSAVSEMASRRSEAASVSTGVLSDTMHAVSGAMAATTANISTVATATEEMTSTIAEIAANTEKARGITQQAVERTHDVSATMEVLRHAADEIGKVSDTINEISAQTNMLALNATIEAARAGNAGKGFAVVATEIKELSRQTALATEDIKKRIAAIQDSTNQASRSISIVSSVIEETNTIVAGIAASVEQQSTVTKDIAGTITRASATVEASHDSLVAAANTSREISGEVSDINQSANEIAISSAQVLASADELSRLAESLHHLSERFAV